MLLKARRIRINTFLASNSAHGIRQWKVKSPLRRGNDQKPQFIRFSFPFQLDNRLFQRPTNRKSIRPSRRLHGQRRDEIFAQRRLFSSKNETNSACFRRRAPLGWASDSLQRRKLLLQMCPSESAGAGISHELLRWRGHWSSLWRRRSDSRIGSKRTIFLLIGGKSVNIFQAGVKTGLLFM